MTEKIDAHHHLWRYDAIEYGWISEDMKALARDFLPEDLAVELEKSGISGTVAVQARQSLEETRWLLEFAHKFDFIRGVVGWADIRSKLLAEQLDAFRTEDKLRGLRHVLQDEPDEQFLEGADFNRGIAQLTEKGLIYDILIYERQLAAAIAFVDRHPKQIFVLDHVAKPRIRGKVMEPWKSRIKDLAQRENVSCKISGMVTEANWKEWTIEDLRPYFDVVLETFGPERMMAGSDWPVCLLASEHQGWFQTVQELASPLSTDEKELIFGGVAKEVYLLSESGR